MNKKIGIIGSNKQIKIINGLKNAFEILEHSITIYFIEDIPQINFLSSIGFSQNLDLIIVIETEAAHFRNDTNIPIILYLQDPEHYLTIENPDLIALKHPNTKCPIFKTFYLPPAIDPRKYNPNQVKDVFISDISRHDPKEEYLNTLGKSQHIIIKPGNISVRALEALSLKTIPIIIAENDLRFLYRNLGFNESNCYLISIEPTIKTVLIPNYNKEIANNGFQFVCGNHTWKNRATKILEKALENSLL